ncbi:MAG: sensor histidine kinase [Nitrospirae bacterium]|nr:sensor histidine kinase [Nitrospirota bacterium]
MKALRRYLNSQRPSLFAFLSLVWVFLIGVIDYMTGVQISLSIFYLMPIAFAAWFVGKRVGVSIAIASVVAWLSCELLWNIPYSNPFIPYWNAAVRLSVFIIIVFLLSKIKTFNRNLEEKIQERTAALIAEVDERKLAGEKILSYQKDLQMLMQRLSLLEEQKRKEISEELHDNIGQTLALSKIKLTSLQQSTSCPDISSELKEIRELIEQSIQFTRSLSFELSSPILHKLGFIAAIKWLCEHFKEKYGITIEFTHDDIFRQLDADKNVLLFKTIQELLINIVKHANTHMARITMTSEGNNLRIEVKDEGVGLDTSNGDYNRKGSLGLFIIKERINYLGGTFEIASEPKCGTRCTIVVPYKREMV